MKSGEYSLIDSKEKELDKNKVINSIFWTMWKYPVSSENMLSGMVKVGAI